jgi:hypothetical protein
MNGNTSTKCDDEAWMGRLHAKKNATKLICVTIMVSWG